MRKLCFNYNIMDSFMLQCLIFLFCGVTVFANVPCPLGHMCDNTEVTEGFVWDFCQEHNGSMVDRCCLMNKNKTQSALIGLDMTRCNLTEVNITDIPRNDVEIIDLHENHIQYVNAKEFLGFVKLKILYLPLKTECPGGDIAWNYTLSNNNDNFTECVGQLLPCDYLNVSCTINGDCIHAGPGSAKCVCKPNHFGYKCLQEGVFPTTTFIISLCVPCVVLSFVTWFYLRKNVIVPQKEE